MRKIFAVSILLLFASVGHTNDTVRPALSGVTLDVSSINYSWMTEEQYQEGIKVAQKRSNRRPAYTGVDYEGMMKSDLKTIRARILGIKNPSEIDPLFADLEKRYDTLQPDAQLFVAQLLMARLFKGFVFRLVPLAEKTRISHSVLLTFAKRQAALMKVYFPTDEANAFFAYFTQPYDGVTQFKEGEDLQRYLSDVVYPESIRSIDRIKKIDISGMPFVWDNKMLFSGMIDERVDSQDRYTLIGPAEYNAILAAKHMGLHFLSVFRSYTVKNVMALTKELGNLYGVDGFGPSILPNGQVEGVTSAERVKVLSRKQFAGTFKLYIDGPVWMNRSYRHLKEGVRYTRLVWEEVKDKPANENLLLNPAFFAGFSRVINNHIAMWDEMLKGPTLLRSRLTGDTVTADVKGFFTSPPEDLKELLPNRHDESAKKSTVIVKMGQDKKANEVSFHNYFRGRPIGWDNKKYKSLFPKLESEGNVGTAVQILAQSWGGLVLVGPLNAVVR